MKTVTYHVESPSEKFVDFVEHNCEDYILVTQEPGGKVLDIIAFDYILGSFKGNVGFADAWIKHGALCVKLIERKQGRNIE